MACSQRTRLLNTAPKEHPFPWLNRLVLGLFAVCMVYAPFAFGCTTAATRQWLDYGLFTAAGLYLVALVIQRRWPVIPLPLVVLIAVPAVIGCVHALNPKFTHDYVTWQFAPVQDTISFLPGTLDRRATLKILFHLSAIAVGFVALVDLARNRTYRWFLLGSVALAGMAIALVGIYQKATLADSMLWTDQVYPNRRVFFAAFRYHGHAAAFLNFCWPAALALLLRSMQRPGPMLAKIVWSNVTLITLLAVFANTSKAGQGLALAGIVAAVVLFWKELPLQNVSRRTIGFIALVIVCGGLALVLPSLANSLGKWSDFAANPTSFKGRLFAYNGCLRMLPESGWFGFGPGTFGLAFPYYTKGLDNQVTGFWNHAHQDYLQTLIEWGYIGGAALIAIVIGGLLRALNLPVPARFNLKQRNQRRRSGGRHGTRRPDLSLKASLLALGLVAAHALIDFPFQIASLQFFGIVHMAVLWRVRG